MTHTVHPFAHRLGIIKDWKSRWFATNAAYRQNLKCDILLREWLDKKLRGMYVAGVEIERGEKSFRVIIKTSRPGIIIGRSGEGITKLRSEVLAFMKKIKAETKAEIKLEVEEVKSPEASAAIVAQMIAEGLEKRMPFRRVMKQMIDKVMSTRDVKGVRIFLSGRLGGAEMARQEDLKRGRIPLQTFRADIDFKRYEAVLPYGNIGIKVWIYLGDVFKK
ncbi:MAG TPA: 30S ribosomal protein S3 [Candidatus Paceibacterota bacterium]